MFKVINGVLGCLITRQWWSHVGAEGGLGPPKFFIKQLVDIFVNSDPNKFIPFKENICF